MTKLPVCISLMTLLVAAGHAADRGKIVGENLWSLKPVVRPAIPHVIGEAHAENPIDAFILDKLQRAGLKQAGEADKRTLIRRLSFDLLGLPPTPEEVTAFENDRDPFAYEKLVDRMLASPHYGERWARHWLDIAHYADTHGFERDKLREHAWPYRDWVIRAFNEDKPYDAFIREQIAGDVIAPDSRDARIATGFLAAGPWDFVGQAETPSPVLKRQARADDLNDMVTQVITATMGLTINCARCHDHKLDPISQKDYYRLWAVFAGVKRADVEIPPPNAGGLMKQREALVRQRESLEAEISKLEGPSLSLADMIGGGDGRGRKTSGYGIDPNSGNEQRAKRGMIENVKLNVFHRGRQRMIDGVFIPGGGAEATTVSSTGLTITGLPNTSGRAWDAIRDGAVNAQFTTKIDGVDYAADGHRILGLHANSGITFDLDAIRSSSKIGKARLNGVVGYGGRDPKTKADFRLYLDGRLVAERVKFGPENGGLKLDVELPESARFLTMIATDGGDGISHDQVFIGDPKIRELRANDPKALAKLRKELNSVNEAVQALPKPEKFYGIASETAPVVKVLRRGNTEDALDAVQPGAISCAAKGSAEFGDDSMTEGARRTALADWITRKDNPLTARVMVNRLWHHHFGNGIVDTPSDFGNGGGKPSHPELLDWLASEFMRGGWSVKQMQRLMVTSATYQCASVADNELAESRDSSNRLLWRMNPRRLDAESLHDALLSTSGLLNPEMGGPGCRDFDYEEAYAPIYRYITPDKPELWRRSIYRFIVRTTPQRWMSTMDCPDAANLTPARLVTTTALQSLSLMNNAFTLQQADAFAARVRRETGSRPEQQAGRAFQIALQRIPERDEVSAAVIIIGRQGLPQFCRLLLNSNEFVFAD